MAAAKVSAATVLKSASAAVHKKATEAGERSAVQLVLNGYGHRKLPKIEQAAVATSPRGRGTLRLYIWDTAWGVLVLTSGPSIEGEVAWAVEAVPGAAGYVSTVTPDNVKSLAPKLPRGVKPARAAAKPKPAAAKPARKPAQRKPAQRKPAAAKPARKPAQHLPARPQTEVWFADEGYDPGEGGMYGQEFGPYDAPHGPYELPPPPPARPDAFGGAPVGGGLPPGFTPDDLARILRDKLQEMKRR